VEDIRANPRRLRLLGPDPAERLLDWSPWTALVGGRIRSLRKRRGLTLAELVQRVEIRGVKPRFGIGYLSEIERGRGTCPMCIYEAVANALGVPPWVLLGPDEIDKPFSDAEIVLLRTLARLGITPDEAIARIAKAERGGAS
jgi:transcriptional regulator with XRE-family HTH domain